VASGCGRTKLHLEEEEKRQHEQQDGLEIEEETIPSRRKNQGQCGLAGWLEDMSSDITISY